MCHHVDTEGESALVGSTMTEGKCISWIKSEGDVLSKGKSIIVVESDKADMDVETFYDGILAAIIILEGESAPVSSLIDILAAPPVADPAPLLLASAPAPPLSQSGRMVATPYGKKLAKQHKVDIGKLVKTGPYGRIITADVEAATGIAPAAA